MSTSWNNQITYVTIMLLGLVLVGQRLPNIYDDVEAALPKAGRTQAQTTPQVLPSAPAPSVQPSNSPKLLKFNLSLSSPKDLKVKQGDTVAAGVVLADRVKERSRLNAQRQALELSLKQIQARTIIAPPAPMSVPTVKSLPPISYAEEEAEIRTAAMNIEQAERAFQLQQDSLKTEPLAESSSVQRAAVEVQNRQRLLDNQRRKIDAVAMLKDLPPSVSVHEQEILKQKEAELQQAEAGYQQAQAQLSAASIVQTEKLSSLAASLEKARAAHQLAIAKLQTKREQRAYTEYEASVTAARRTEEKNQAAHDYSSQMQEAEQQQRDRSFQLAQIQTKIAEVDNQLSSLSVVTSPYSGTIRRVKILQQNDNNLSIELTLAVSGTSTPSPSSGNNFTHTSTKPFISPISIVGN